MGRMDVSAASASIAAPAVEAYTLQQAPYYLPLADEVEVFLRRLCGAASRVAQRANGLWEDAFRGIYGLSAVPPAGICDG